MIIRDRDGGQLEADVTTEHAASSYGLAVLVVNGEALGTVEAGEVDVVEATGEEVFGLIRAGYGFRCGKHRGRDALLALGWETFES